MNPFNRISRTLVFGALMLAIGVWLGSSFQVGAAGSMEDTTTAYQALALGSDSLSENDRVFNEIYVNVSPSVVAITVAEESSGGTARDVATGSGFIVDTNGNIVTNLHVVENADRIEVNMFDGTITRAEYVGGDEDSDLAVIHIDLPADRLRPVVLGDSDAMQVGDTVLAIGNPFSNDWTLTSGIVSAINRSINGLNNYRIGGVIQTDAAINPGNSGGPLLNLRGEVIGVNSQIYSQTRSNSGVGFAAPSNLVRRVLDELIANGEVSYSYIGIVQRDIDLDLIESWGLPNNIRGVAIRQAVDGFPAALAGLRTMTSDSIDIITAIDGVPMTNFDQLIGYLAINTFPGQTVDLTVYRSGEVLTLPVTLSERPGR
ncbi:MAG: trypsin-like peptidase domain-containing protein [Anaerolineae bacterium]|nr:trypsin-like peptidase domain-containing protein [Anaerolineae bacterium]MCA9893193.1 trypsin-like peptidase domain-containing protein [Anaerolineae bacterium]MCB9458087.1 trypsin-like peptidase domain-containing protein [Anaerolineaceae bacterium]